MRASTRHALLACGLLVASAAGAQNFAWNIRQVGDVGGDNVSLTAFDNLGRVVGNAQLPGTATTRGFMDDNGTFVRIGTPGQPALVSHFNARGELLGYGQGTDGEWRHYIYRNGVPSPLIIPEAYSTSGVGARGLNDSGQVVMTYQTAPHGPYRTSLIEPDGRITNIGTLGGSNALALGMTPTGRVFGISTVRGDLASHAFVYENGTMTDVGTLGGVTSYAAAMNARGDLLGHSDTNGYDDPHAFIYSNGVMTDLGTLGGDMSQGFSINEHRQVVGYSAPDPAASRDLTHAFLYSDGQMTDLDPLFGDSNWSRGMSINDLGQVLAQAHVTDRNGERATHLFFYDKGQAIDLTRYMRESFNDVVDITPYQVVLNDVGQIALQATLYGGMTRLFVLTPVPEPAALGLMLAGLAALGLSSRRRRG